MIPPKALSPQDKDQMNVVFVGHVDHGKSTIIGRLLADTNSLPKGKLEQVQLQCAKNHRPFEYAYLIDALKDEQAQNITIDSARIFFQSKIRNYIIIDAPGHIEFIKNMVTGASHAEAAVLIIDAGEGVQENSRRHGYLLWMLGIQHIVVAINKMDLVGFDQAVYQNLVREYGEFLKGIGVQPLCYIPVSGREGDGVVFHSRKMPWYEGKTVLEALDAFQKQLPLVDQPMRLPVQDVYKLTGQGDNRRIVAGTISSGSLCAGDRLAVYPSGKQTDLQEFVAFNEPEKPCAQSGMAVGFTMGEQIYIRRGEIISRAGDPAPAVSTRMRVSLFWLGKQPLEMHRPYLLKLGTAKERVEVETIHRVIDASDYASQNSRTAIHHHDVAEVTLKLAHPMAFDTSDRLPDTSRFVLVDEYEICGGGIVLEALQDDSSQLRQEVYLRNQKWIRGIITQDQREERHNQRATLVIITGQKGAGRKRLAGLLESRLFADGRQVYYLGIGSVLYSVNADLKRNPQASDWHEHVRRFGEVCHLFIDAGMILIVTAVELTQADLEILKTVIDAERIETIWLGPQVTTDLECDILLNNNEDFEHITETIRQRLLEHGVILRS